MNDLRDQIEAAAAVAKDRLDRASAQVAAEAQALDLVLAAWDAYTGEGEHFDDIDMMAKVIAHVRLVVDARTESYARTPASVSQRLNYVETGNPDNPLRST